MSSLNTTNDADDGGQPTDESEQPSFVLAGVLAFLSIITFILLVCLACWCVQKFMERHYPEKKVKTPIIDEESNIERCIEAERNEIKLLERAIQGRPSDLDEIERYEVLRATFNSQIEFQHEHLNNSLKNK